MVLHLVPDGFDLIELEEIRLFADDPQPKTPMIHEWTSDNKEQTIIHQATGCRFRAIRLQSPLVNGLTLPFEHTSRDSGQVRWHEEQCAPPRPRSNPAARTRGAGVGIDLHVRVVATTSLKNRFTRTPFAPVRLPVAALLHLLQKAFGEIVGQDASPQ